MWMQKARNLTTRLEEIWFAQPVGKVVKPLFDLTAMQGPSGFIWGHHDIKHEAGWVGVSPMAFATERVHVGMQVLLRKLVLECNSTVCTTS